MCYNWYYATRKKWYATRKKTGMQLEYNWCVTRK